MVKWKTIFKEAAAIVLIAVALAGIGYTLRPDVIPSGNSDKSSGANGDGQGSITVISLEDARVHFEKGTALFADARPKSAYAAGHIKGAINLDPDEFDAWSGNFFSQVPQDRAVIVYCEQAQYRQSVALAEKLTWMGYEKIYSMKTAGGSGRRTGCPSIVSVNDGPAPLLTCRQDGVCVSSGLWGLSRHKKDGKKGQQSFQHYD